MYDILTIDEIRIAEYARRNRFELTLTQYQPANLPMNNEPIINRLLSRAYRLKLAYNLMRFEIPSINAWHLIRNSDFKPRAKILFQNAGLPAPKGLLIQDCFFTEGTGSLVLNESRLQQILDSIDRFNYPIVIKPTRGSRGTSVFDFENTRQLLETIHQIFHEYINKRSISIIPLAFYQNLQNAGTYVERKYPHALDLRIAVAKYRGGQPTVLGCLARLGKDELQLAKNTAQGAIPIGIEAPANLKELAIRAAESVAEGASTYIVGVDILPAQEDINERQRIYTRASQTIEVHRMVREQAKKTEEVVRALQQHHRSVEQLLRNERLQHEIIKMDKLFQYFVELYTSFGVVDEIKEYLKRANYLLTEVNTRPDFGINTHNVATPLLPEAYLKAIDSLLP